MKAHFVVIGNPIEHSSSPHIHQKFADQVGIDIQYERQFCPNNDDSFNAVVKAFFNGGGIGANVTVPFKQMAYDICGDCLSVEARIAGAVNTLYLQDNKIYGHNTDGQGLVNHLSQLSWNLKKSKVAVIGAGGASRGIILPLLLAGVEQIHIANRTVSKAESLIKVCKEDVCNLSPRVADLLINANLSSSSIEDLKGQYDLIINATSVGLSKDRLKLSDALTTKYAYDMMYGKELFFLNYFSNKGAIVSDGYGMLIGQAALSFELWTGKSIDIDSLEL